MSQIELIPLSLHRLASSPVFLVWVRNLTIFPLTRTFRSSSWSPSSNESPKTVNSSPKWSLVCSFSLLPSSFLAWTPLVAFLVVLLLSVFFTSKIARCLQNSFSKTQLCTCYFPIKLVILCSHRSVMCPSLPYLCLETDICGLHHLGFFALLLPIGFGQ